MIFKDCFSTKSRDYANYRPRYPQELTDELAKICARPEIALDCGCGTGQLSVLLANCFSAVIAIDASQKQIENAEARPNISYKVATAEDTKVANQSVDIITVAQAAHWLDLDSFYAEARRALKPDGVISLITYGVLHIDDAKCNAIVQDFYKNILGPYWSPERKHVESGYKTLKFPFKEEPFPSSTMSGFWNFHQLFGYIATWSAFKALEGSYRSQQIDEFYQKLSSAWAPLDVRKLISWPLSGRIGRV